MPIFLVVMNVLILGGGGAVLLLHFISIDAVLPSKKRNNPTDRRPPVKTLCYNVPNAYLRLFRW